MKIDKQNGTCMYNDKEHVYWDSEDNTKYISVTTLIHKYCQEFDEAFWSAYKALEALTDPAAFKPIKSVMIKLKKFNIKFLELLGVDESDFNNKRAEIIQQWEDNKNKACERGTAIHLGKELEYYKAPEHHVKFFGLGGSFKCEKDHYEMNLDKGIYPEYLVAKKTNDGKLKIAGQIDLLIKDGNDIYIIDYKTNKKLDKQSYFNPSTKKHEMMKYPLNNVMDCNMMHYTLQLSLYAYLLQIINPEFNVKQLMIIHYDHDGNETHHELEYKKKEIQLMLKHYKKTMVLEKRKENRKPIEY